MNTSVEEMIGQYVSAWNEASLEAYQAEFAKCWTPDAVYVDPYSEVKGLEALANFAFRSLDIMPDRKFSIFEVPEYHHQAGKYTWQVDVSGQKNTGVDYFEYNENFEITRLVSFFKLPEDYPLEKLK